MAAALHRGGRRRAAAGVSLQPLLLQAMLGLLLGLGLGLLAVDAQDTEPVTMKITWPTQHVRRGLFTVCMHGHRSNQPTNPTSHPPALRA